jgi:hypothetical protein
MNDELSPAKQVVLRVWKFAEFLDLARVPEEDRKSIVLEVTREEAWDLLKVAGTSPEFHIRFLVSTSPDTYGVPDEHEVRISLASLGMARMPQQGERWAELCGLTLAWLGK